MERVLVAPTKSKISNSEYGKNYNIINNFDSDIFKIDVLTQHVEDEPSPTNVCAHPIGGKSEITYKAKLYAHILTQLNNGSTNIYHHMEMNYGWFNPVIISGRYEDIPIVIGPCQTGHKIFEEEFNNLLSSWTGTQVNKNLSDLLYKIAIPAEKLLMSPIRETLFKNTIERANKIIVVHEEAKRFYSTITDESKIEVIPLGVDINEFEYTAPKNNCNIVAIGSLRERKGYDILLDAFKQIKNQYESSILHIFGEGPRKSELVSLSKELGIVSSVHFHGYVDQNIIRQHLSESRVFVHPSRSESFSLVRLEAMASGSPVVISNTSGAEEMVDDGKEGFVVPIESSKDIYHAVNKIFSDFSLTKQISKNARQKVEHKYRWEKIASEYMRVYNSLI
jgi:glycosyltransferase involved in cell wall biosynthesis